MIAILFPPISRDRNKQKSTRDKILQLQNECWTYQDTFSMLALVTFTVCIGQNIYNFFQSPYLVRLEGKTPEIIFEETMKFKVL